MSKAHEALRQVEESQTNKSEESFFANKRILLEEEAELYLWDIENNEFAHQGVVVARFSQEMNSNFVFFLTASNDKGTLLCHNICSDMNEKFSAKLFSLTWNHLGDDENSQSSWLLRFKSEEDYEIAKQIFTQCRWESLHQMQWGKAKVGFIGY